MHVVALCSQKGGSGKTTLSGHLGVQAEQAGAGPVALIDTDPQGSLAAWWNARRSDRPAFIATSLAQLPADVDRLRQEGFGVVVIDTPPATILPDAIPLMSHVDGVVMVIGLDRDTEDELSELRQRLEQVDAPVIGVIANFAQAPDERYYRYLHAHEAAVAEASAVPLQPATQAQTQPASRQRRRRRPSRRRRREAETAAPIDLNRVTYDELRRLDLSTTQAKRVLAYRDRLGGFSSIDEIDEVPGFPDELRNALKQRVTV
jgi:chromosome partitioning protein